MPNTCVKIVYSLGIRLGKLLGLRTDHTAHTYWAVHISSYKPQARAQLLPVLFHSLVKRFYPVVAVVIPAIHSTYNKQLRIKERNFY